MPSRISDIDFTFGQEVTVRAVVEALAGAGWSLKEPLGLSYMVSIDDAYDWEFADIEAADKVLALLDAPENFKREVGICVHHEEAETGGSLLFQAGRTECAFIPNINGRSPAADRPSTDASWYVQALVNPLLPIGLHSYEPGDIGF
ncbi:hypothetical protein [Streptomyces sp. NBC_01465]|uniref:hypothetical protein n=1 Tax=Streptomyces sp. NBC_01465 TaxID=2903878 RepID=UPI002E300FDE|nr:hypothetical protein [Streptomyces sp. NBC_01465]